MHSTPSPQSPTCLLVTPPRVLILYAAPPIVETTGYEVVDRCEFCGDALTDLGAHGMGCARCADAECDEPRVGEVIAVKVRLPHGVTDRFVERTETGYVDVNGDPVEGEIVSWEYPSADSLADWEQAKRESCLACRGSGFFAEVCDAGYWHVHPTHEDDPKAKRCACDGSLDAWR